MKMLKSRLYEIRQREQSAERDRVATTKKDIAWGNQIRSYVFHPYTMVKDHRTHIETTDARAVMDGSIDAFIQAYLQKNAYEV